MNSRKKFILFAIFIFISIFISLFSGYLGLNQSSISSFISANNSAVALIYTLLFIGLTTFSFSVSVMTTLGALFFPGLNAVIYSMIGIMGSSIIDFYISRKLGKNYVRNYLEKRGGKLERFDNILEKDTFKTTMILSAIFFVPPAIPNFLGGIMKINLKNYSIATFIGNLPNTFLTIYLIKGFLYPNSLLIYGTIAGLIIVSLVSLYFYKGETRDILRISFPWIFMRKNKEQKD
jgi:uncharacterized membrane protein YdjX (TVP38/TMEM64 family)